MKDVHIGNSSFTHADRTPQIYRLQIRTIESNWNVECSSIIVAQQNDSG